MLRLFGTRCTLTTCKSNEPTTLKLLSLDSDESNYVAYCETTILRNTVSRDLPAVCWVDVVDVIVISLSLRRNTFEFDALVVLINLDVNTFDY